MIGIGEAAATSRKNCLWAGLERPKEKYPGVITMATSAPASDAFLQRVMVSRVLFAPLFVSRPISSSDRDRLNVRSSNDDSVVKTSLIKCFSSSSEQCHSLIVG